MAYKRGRTLGSWGQLFGPLLVDSSSVSPTGSNTVRLTQLAVLILQRRLALAIPPDIGGGGTVGAGTDPTEGIGLCGAPDPIAWTEITPVGSSTTYRFSKVPINTGDPKDPRVKSHGQVTRALSLPNDGAYRGAQRTCVLIDKDRVLRGLEDSDSLIDARIVDYLSTATAIAAGLQPRRVFDGVITDSQPGSDLEFQIQATDYISSLLDAADAAKTVYPQRLFTATDFPGIANDPSDPIRPGNPSIINKPVPIGYGMLSDEYRGAAAEGVVPGVFTGMVTLPGGSPTGGWYEFTFFGHAVIQQSYFLPTGPLSTSSVAARRKYVPGVDEAQADYVFPNTSAWDTFIGSGAPPYFDVNGRRYFKVYGLGPRALLNATGQVPLLGNFGGIEDVGDGTGNVITGLFRQFAHLLVNFVFQNYQSGAWLSPPAVPGDLYSRIAIATLEACQTISERYVAGGFEGAFVLGNGGESLSFRNLLAKLCLNSAAQNGQNADGQLIFDMVDPSRALNRSIADVIDVTAGSFAARKRRDQIANHVTYKYGKRYAPALAQATPASGALLPTSTTVQPDPDWQVSTEVTPDAPSVAKYGDRQLPLELDMVRDPATAEAVAQLTQATLKSPPVEVNIGERLCGTNTDLGDRDELTHFEGVTSAGYIDRSMRCEVHTLDLDAPTQAEPQNPDVAKQYRDLAAIDFSALEI